MANDLPAVYRRLTALGDFLTDPRDLRLTTQADWLGANYFGQPRALELDAMASTRESAARIRDVLGAYLARGQQVFFVAVLGMLKAGKSSVINSLVGAVQIVDDIPVPHQIEFIVAPDNADAVRPFTDGRFGTVGGVPFKVAEVAQPFLADIILVDTEGAGATSAAEARRAALVREFLPFCDLAVFVVRPGMVTVIDIELMVRKEIELPQMPAVYVMTHADQFRKSLTGEMTDDNIDGGRLRRAADNFYDRVAQGVRERAGEDATAANRAAAVRTHPLIQVSTARDLCWNTDELREHLTEAALRHLVTGRATVHQEKVNYFTQKERAAWAGVGEFVRGERDRAAKRWQTMQDTLQRFTDREQLREVTSIVDQWVRRHAAVRAATDEFAAACRLPPDHDSPVNPWTLPELDAVWQEAHRCADADAARLGQEVEGRGGPELSRRIVRRADATAAELRADDPTAFTVPRFAEEEVVDALAVRSPVPLTPAAASTLGPAVAKLPRLMTAVANRERDAATAALRTCGGGLGSNPAARFEGEVGGAEQFVRDELERVWFNFYDMFRLSVTNANSGHEPYAAWPAVHAKVSAANGELTPARRGELAGRVTSRLFPPPSRSAALGKLAADVRRVSERCQSLAADAGRVDVGVIHPEYSQYARDGRTAPDARTAEAYACAVRGVTASVNLDLEQREAAARADIAQYLAKLRGKWLLLVGSIALLLGMAILLFVRWRLEAAGGDFNKMLGAVVSTVFGLGLSAYKWLWSKSDAQRVGLVGWSYSPEVLEACREKVRAAFAQDHGYHIAAQLRDQALQAYRDGLTRLPDAAFAVSFWAAYAELRRCREDAIGQVHDLARDVCAAGAEYAALFHYGTDRENMVNVFNDIKEDVVAASRAATRDIAADWEELAADLDRRSC